MIKIGVVVHGPEVIDSGSAIKVLNRLKDLGVVTAVLGGTMGRLAIIDAGLQEAIGLSSHRRPSNTLKDLQIFMDLIVLLNEAKTMESGLAFGSAVAFKAAPIKPIVQVDCGGRFVSALTSDGHIYAARISDLLGLELLKPPAEQRSTFIEGDIVKRKLKGVLPGELISINGTVVAKAVDSCVEVHSKSGKIIGFKGAKLKVHGIEKLPIIDLEKAIIRSGDIRRTEGEPKAVDCIGSGAVIIDHCAEEAFDIAQGACLAVTIGDDTTAIAGDILCRLGIPIIGIIDGDLDRLSHKTTIAKNSSIFQVEQGYDDIVGRMLKLDVFAGGTKINIEKNDILEKLRQMAKGHLIEIINY